MKQMADWLLSLEEEDINFIKRFVLASGSLKEMADSYGVTYPTVRNRLNKIIKKIESLDSQNEEEYIKLIKRLTINNQIDFDAATLLIETYRKERKQHE